MLSMPGRKLADRPPASLRCALSPDHGPRFRGTARTARESEIASGVHTRHGPRGMAGANPRATVARASRTAGWSPRSSFHARAHWRWPPAAPGYATAAARRCGAGGAPPATWWRPQPASCIASAVTTWPARSMPASMGRASGIPWVLAPAARCAHTTPSMWRTTPRRGRGGWSAWPSPRMVLPSRAMASPAARRYRNVPTAGSSAPAPPRSGCGSSGCREAAYCPVDDARHNASPWRVARGRAAAHFGTARKLRVPVRTARTPRPDVERLVAHPSPRAGIRHSGQGAPQPAAYTKPAYCAGSTNVSARTTGWPWTTVHPI